MESSSHKKRYNNPVTATLTGIRDLFRKQNPAGELKPTDRLDGKNFVVDGASSGLGYAIALEAARRGASVVMVCRSGIPEMGERIKKTSGNGNVRMVYIDFSDAASIKESVGHIRDLCPKIDILVSNAGIVPKESRKTAQGLEEMFMVNYFSKFLFVTQLIEKGCLGKNVSLEEHVKPESEDLEKSKTFLPRIIFIASESHRNPERFDWEDFGKYRDYSIGKSIELYGYYKLLLTTFAVELSRRLNRSGTVCSVFAMCPGPVNSNIAREAPAIFKPLLKLVFGIFFKSPGKAAIPAIYLAASHDIEGTAFDYMFLMSRKPVDEKAEDPEAGNRLWELSDSLRKGL